MKTMLTMAQTTGAQIKPLLNLELKAPDFSGLEQQLTALNARTKEFAAAQTESALVTGVETTAVKKSSVTHAEHEESLRKVRREAVQTFAVVAFLSQSVMQLAATTENASKTTEKLNKGMSEGISLGFELAMAMKMLGVESGGVAVGIGAAVTIGVTLLKFFDDAEEKAANAKKAMDGFEASLSGMSVFDLKKQREEYQKGIDDIEKKKKELEKIINTPSTKPQQLKNQYTMPTDFEDTEYSQKKAQAKKDLKTTEQTLKNHIAWRDGVDAKLKASMVTFADAKKSILELQANVNDNAFKKERELEKIAYDEKVIKTRETITDEKQRNDAIKLLGEEHLKNLNDIAKREQADRIQHFDERKQFEKTKDDADFETKLSLLKQQGILLGRSTEEIDNQITEEKINRKKEELARELSFADQTEPQRLAKEAELEKDIHQLEEQSLAQSIAIANKKFTQQDEIEQKQFEASQAALAMHLHQQGASEQEITEALLVEVGRRLRIREAELAAKQGPRTNEDVQAQANLEKLITENKRDQVAARKALVESEIEASRELFSQSEQLFGKLISLKQNSDKKELDAEKKRQYAQLESDKKISLSHASSAEERDAINQNYANKKDQIDQQLNDKAQASVRELFIAQKAFAIATALIDTYKGASAAIAMGPIGIPLAAVVIAAGLANVAAITAQEVPGYEKGGRLKKGQAGYFEGTKNEIVAPDEDFVTVFKKYLHPQIFSGTNGRSFADTYMPEIKPELLPSTSYRQLSNRQVQQATAELGYAQSATGGAQSGSALAKMNKKIDDTNKNLEKMLSMFMAIDDDTLITKVDKKNLENKRKGIDGN